MAIYNLLRTNGVADEDIILFSVDDIPWVSENPLPGNIHYEVEGANIRKNAAIDYAGDSVTLANLKNVLLGKSTEDTPVVLESNQNTNVLVYIVGHGMPRAINFNNGDQLIARGLVALLDEMFSLQRYRQMLIMVESCYGESLATDIATPGVVYFTGASRIESSFGAVYDHNIKQWLADDFTSHTIKALATPGITLEELYVTVYNRVTGSHVRLVNNANFGDTQTPVSVFFMP